MGYNQDNSLKDFVEKARWPVLQTTESTGAESADLQFITLTPDFTFFNNYQQHKLIKTDAETGQKVCSVPYIILDEYGEIFLRLYKAPLPGNIKPKHEKTVFELIQRLATAQATMIHANIPEDDTKKELADISSYLKQALVDPKGQEHAINTANMLLDAAKTGLKSSEIEILRRPDFELLVYRDAGVLEGLKHLTNPDKSARQSTFRALWDAEDTITAKELNQQNTAPAPAPTSGEQEWQPLGISLDDGNVGVVLCPFEAARKNYIRPVGNAYPTHVALDMPIIFISSQGECTYFWGQYTTKTEIESQHELQDLMHLACLAYGETAIRLDTFDQTFDEEKYSLVAEAVEERLRASLLADPSTEMLHLVAEIIMSYGDNDCGLMNVGHFRAGLHQSDQQLVNTLLNAGARVRAEMARKFVTDYIKHQPGEETPIHVQFPDLPEAQPTDDTFRKLLGLSIKEGGR